MVCLVKVAVPKEKSATFFMCLTTPTGSSGKPTGVSTKEKKDNFTEMMATVTEMIAILKEITNTGGNGQGQIVGADTIMIKGHLQGQTILGVDTQDLGQDQMKDDIKNLNIEDQEIQGQGRDQIPGVILDLGQDLKEGNMISPETDHVQGHSHGHILIDIQDQD